MGRDVAIKISAERFSDRFEREVRAVAALNHSNICQIYDVGPNYLVMELVEGPTLADRIKQGALPLDEALRIARQIGDALEAAHEKGIIHRDLKPANIKVKPDGTVKVLDFGLAKVAQASACEDPEASPTLTIQDTVAGQILGTAAYMAPEQARGLPVDKRADIWAFGVVLYEMLTGQRLFGGNTISDALVAVLKEEPEWNRVPSNAHRLLKSCLEKDPKHRLRDIGDSWRLLQDAPEVWMPRSGAMWKVVAAVSWLAFAVALWSPWRGAGLSIARPPVRLDIDLGSNVSLESAAGPAVVLSPDGTRLAFASRGDDGILRLFTRRLDRPKVTLLTGSEGAYGPFFSPDGQWIGFFAQEGKLKKVPTDGGAPVALCDAPDGRGASWGEAGTIIAALSPQQGLSQVPFGGGPAIPLTELSPGEGTHRWPQVLPGGKHVLFTFNEYSINFDRAGIAVVSLKDRKRKTLLEHAGMYPRYLPSGHLVYITNGTLFAVPFNLDRLEVTGPATRLDEVSVDLSRGFAELDFSPSGILAYRAGEVVGLGSVRWLDAAGKTEPLGIEDARYSYPRLSPDGGRLAYVGTQGSSSDIWIYDWERSLKIRLTNGRVAALPVWSPDGRFIVFQSAGGMFWMQADGAGMVRQLTQSKNLQFPHFFTADGKRFVFTEATSGTSGEIRSVSVEIASGQMKVGEPTTYLKTSTAPTFAALSPDGRWLAYQDSPEGRFEVYVRAFPDNSIQVRISKTEELCPRGLGMDGNCSTAPWTSGSW
jgi:serine/threonine-protein kinase